MLAETVTLKIPERFYRRFENTARATQRSVDELLERNQDGLLTEAEKLELQTLRMEANRFMLRKAHAAALLRWRGHHPTTL